MTTTRTASFRGRPMPTARTASAPGRPMPTTRTAAVFGEPMAAAPAALLPARRAGGPLTHTRTALPEGRG
ncbi:hypothetical protein [Streptomyces bacillaris]|uniref:hypothetical protein n=1 Tax=Streptomyces bacillaris TaxID=68179 RepID=UPI0013A6B703